MKENLYTIPIIDAFSQTCECPFCFIHKELEKNYLDFILASAYMEDYIRFETDEKGFCMHHYKQMYKMQNALGLALMTHTNLVKFNKDTLTLFNSIIKSSSEKKSNLFRNKSLNKDILDLINILNKKESSCYLCDKINKTFDDYMDNFFHLIKKDYIPLINSLKEISNFCLPHLKTLLEKGLTSLNQKQLSDFLLIVMPIQKEILISQEKDLSWFISKFDYQNKDMPWKNSKDALPKAIKKITGLNDL